MKPTKRKAYCFLSELRRNCGFVFMRRRRISFKKAHLRFRCAFFLAGVDKKDAD
jgi:hypothetical protein